MADKKYIYFYYNRSQKKPLYIGQTVDVLRRFKQHTSENSKFSLVDKICFFPLPEFYTKEQVNITEAIFIQQMRPNWNCIRDHFIRLDNDIFLAMTALLRSVEQSKGWSNFVEECCDTLQVKNGVIKWQTK